MRSTPPTGGEIARFERGFRRHLSEAASWAKINNDDSVRGVAAPFDVNSHLYCEPNLPLPFLEGLMVTPGFDKDGNLMDQPGYQPTAYTFYLE